MSKLLIKDVSYSTSHMRLDLKSLLFILVRLRLKMLLRFASNKGENYIFIKVRGVSSTGHNGHMPLINNALMGGI